MKLNAETGICEATVYYKYHLTPANMPDEEGVPLSWEGEQGEHGGVIWITKEAMRRAKIEATAVLPDFMESIVINYDPSTRKWTESPYPYGLGNRGNPLIPYRIVAADQSIYPFGSRVTLVIPDFAVDGSRERETGDSNCVVAYVGDTGGAIKGERRFDIYQTSATDRSLHGKWWCCVEPPPLLDKHFSWEGVPALQTGLNKIGASLEIDGLFGPKSRAALTAFQKTVPEIPELEYGNRQGAITRFWLAKAVSERKV